MLMRIGFCTLYQGCQYFSRIATNILRNSNFIWCPDSIRLPFGLQTKTNFTVRNYCLIFNNLIFPNWNGKSWFQFQMKIWQYQWACLNSKWNFTNTNDKASIQNDRILNFQIPTRKSQFQMQYCQFHRANLN